MSFIERNRIWAVGRKNDHIKGTRHPFKDSHIVFWVCTVAVQDHHHRIVPVLFHVWRHHHSKAAEHRRLEVTRNTTNSTKLFLLGFKAVYERPPFPRFAECLQVRV